MSVSVSLAAHSALSEMTASEVEKCKRYVVRVELKVHVLNGIIGERLWDTSRQQNSMRRRIPSKRAT
jgi:hypothetical protein